MHLDAVLVIDEDPGREVTTVVVAMVGPCSEEAGCGEESTSDRIWGCVLTSIMPSSLIFLFIVLLLSIVDTVS